MTINSIYMTIALHSIDWSSLLRQRACSIIDVFRGNLHI